MFRLVIIFLFCLSLSSIRSQDHCIFYGRFIPTDLYPQGASTFNSNSHIDFYEDSIVINQVTHPVKDLTITPFDNRDDLLRIFSCIYNFYSYSENIQGKVLTYEFTEEVAGIGKDLTFVQFNDSGAKRYFVFVDDGLYRFANYQSYGSCWSDVIRFIPETEIQYQYITEIDTVGEVSMISEPEFEMIDELVLVKEASTKIEIIPATFDTTWAYFHQQFSNCPEAVYDTTYEQILKREVADMIEVHPAEFTTIYEQVLARESFVGAAIYDRMLKPLDTIVLKSERVFPILDNVAENCSQINFINCLEYSWDINPSVDTVLKDTYQKCLEGYSPAGSKCYTTGALVPAEYETRTYQKLIKPATISITQSENEYVTVGMVRISNKDELESNCVQIRVDSMEYIKIEQPFQTNTIPIPAEYGTRTFKRYLQGGEIEVISVGQDEVIHSITLKRDGTYNRENVTVDCSLQFGQCHRRAIARRLFEKGYLVAPEIISDLPFYSAIFNYQLDHDLLIGVVDEDFIDHLEVIFGF